MKRNGKAKKEVAQKHLRENRAKPHRSKPAGNAKKVLDHLPAEQGLAVLRDLAVRLS